MAPEGLYRSKPRVQSWLAPVASGLARRGVTSDGLTLAALFVAAGGGLALALSAQQPLFLLLVPPLAAARLVLNLLDGMVARAGGRPPRPIGELWNELGDRAADVVFLAGLAAVPSVGPVLASAAIVAALLSSYVGVASRAAGGRRLYGGIMSKPGRMIVLAVAAPLAWILSNGWPLAAAAFLVAAGSAVTMVQRLLTAIRELGHTP